MRPNCFDRIRKHCTGAVFARNHCPSVLRSHWALEMTARACSVATGRSKSLLELTFWPLGAPNHCSSLLSGASEATARSKSVLEHASVSFEASERSKSLLERALKPLSVRNHCSSMLLFPSKALSSMLLCPSKALSIMFVFPSKSLSKSLCFELCIASSCTLCDFTGAKRRHM